jgi:hypothetical protein
LAKYKELRQQIEITMRLEDEDKAKDFERLAEMRQMSAERKKAKARLMEFGEFVDIGEVDKEDDEQSLEFNMSHKRDINVDLADAITPQKSPQLNGHSTEEKKAV